MNTQKKFSTRGITILETVISIGMFAFVMIGLSSAILFFYRTSGFVFQESTAITSAQQGIDRMIRVMREAAYSSTGAYPIVSLANNDIIFYADVDSDSSVERVHYYVSGTDLYQGIVNPTGDPASYAGTEVTTSVAQYVRNISLGLASFSYYNASGTLMTDLAQVGSVRFITANVAVDIDTNRSPTAITIRSSAALRNLVGK